MYVCRLLLHERYISFYLRHYYLEFLVTSSELNASNITVQCFQYNSLNECETVNSIYCFPAQKGYSQMFLFRSSLPGAKILLSNLPSPSCGQRWGGKRDLYMSSIFKRCLSGDYQLARRGGGDSFYSALWLL